MPNINPSSKSPNHSPVMTRKLINEKVKVISNKIIAVSNAPESPEPMSAPIVNRDASFQVSAVIAKITQGSSPVPDTEDLYFAIWCKVIEEDIMIQKKEEPSFLSTPPPQSKPLSISDEKNITKLSFSLDVGSKAVPLRSVKKLRLTPDKGQPENSAVILSRLLNFKVPGKNQRNLIERLKELFIDNKISFSFSAGASSLSTDPRDRTSSSSEDERDSENTRNDPSKKLDKQLNKLSSEDKIEFLAHLNKLFIEKIEEIFGCQKDPILRAKILMMTILLLSDVKVDDKIRLKKIDGKYPKFKVYKKMSKEYDTQYKAACKLSMSDSQTKMSLFNFLASNLFTTPQDSEIQKQKIKPDEYLEFLNSYSEELSLMLKECEKK